MQDKKWFKRSWNDTLTNSVFLIALRCTKLRLLQNKRIFKIKKRITKNKEDAVVQRIEMTAVKLQTMLEQFLRKIYFFADRMWARIEFNI